MSGRNFPYLPSSSHRTHPFLFPSPWAICTVDAIFYMKFNVFSLLFDSLSIFPILERIKMNLLIASLAFCVLYVCPPTHTFYEKHKINLRLVTMILSKIKSRRK